MTYGNLIKSFLVRIPGAVGLISAGILITTATAQPNVIWQTPVDISGTADVSTLGALFGTLGTRE